MKQGFCKITRMDLESYILSKVVLPVSSISNMMYVSLLQMDVDSFKTPNSLPERAFFSLSGNAAQ